MSKKSDLDGNSRRPSAVATSTPSRERCEWSGKRKHEREALIDGSSGPVSQQPLPEAWGCHTALLFLTSNASELINRSSHLSSFVTLTSHVFHRPSVTLPVGTDRDKSRIRRHPGILITERKPELRLRLRLIKCFFFFSHYGSNPFHHKQSTHKTRMLSAYATYVPVAAPLNL